MSSVARSVGSEPERKRLSRKQSKTPRKSGTLLPLEGDVVVPEGWGRARLPARVPVLIGVAPLSASILADRR